MPPRYPFLLRRRWLWRRLEVEEHRPMSTPRYSVNHRVVCLGQDRKAVALKALGQPQLPQWLGAVELLGKYPAGEPSELLLAAGLRQGGVSDVVGEIEVDIVGPKRSPASIGGTTRRWRKRGTWLSRPRTCSTRSR